MVQEGEAMTTSRHKHKASRVLAHKGIARHRNRIAWQPALRAFINGANAALRSGGSIVDAIRAGEHKARRAAKALRRMTRRAKP